MNIPIFDNRHKPRSLLLACRARLWIPSRNIFGAALVSWFLFSLTLDASLAAAEFRAGIAVRVVTPDSLLPVSGGVGPSHPVSRKEGDLTVRALVLQGGETRVAIVSADFLGFPSVLGNKVRAKARGIPPENILIGATHTHSAPDCYGFPDGKGGFASDLAYLDTVCAKMAEAINEASEKMQPASLKIATGEAKGSRSPPWSITRSTRKSSARARGF